MSNISSEADRVSLVQLQLSSQGQGRLLAGCVTNGEAVLMERRSKGLPHGRVGLDAIVGGLGEGVTEGGEAALSLRR